jgi:hypothetical protein
MFGIDTQERPPYAAVYLSARKARAEYLATLLRSSMRRLSSLFSQVPHHGATTHS